VTSLGTILIGWNIGWNLLELPVGKKSFSHFIILCMVAPRLAAIGQPYVMSPGWNLIGGSHTSNLSSPYDTMHGGERGGGSVRKRESKVDR